MADTLLESSAVSAFCGSFAAMIAAGLQVEEAANLLARENADGPFKQACEKVYQAVTEGRSLGEAMAQSQAFPKFACQLIITGESSGHTEDVLVALEQYYSEEDRLFAKLRTDIRYPSILLVVMSVVLLITNIFVLPTFASAYTSISGSLTGGSFGMLTVSVALGWVALAITLVFAVLSLVLSVSANSQSGREKLQARLANFGPTRQAFYQLALARFTQALSAYLSSGIDSLDAMGRAVKDVDHPELSRRVNQAYKDMENLDNPVSLVHALTQNDVYDAFYASMLQVGDHTASLDVTLNGCAQIFFEDALDQLDRATDSAQPLLTALLTVAVASSLVAAMIPLVGIMQSIA